MTRLTYKGTIGEDFELPEDGIYVFGSNTEGRHGKGSALIAKEKYGAVYGQAEGRQGRCWAIITKDLTKKIHPSIPEWRIIHQIDNLYYYACVGEPDKKFYVVYSGLAKSNLNNYTPNEMANMFATPNVKLIPKNIIFEENFWLLVEKHFEAKESSNGVCDNYENGFYGDYDTDLCTNCGERKAKHIKTSSTPSLF